MSFSELPHNQFSSVDCRGLQQLVATDELHFCFMRTFRLPNVLCNRGSDLRSLYDVHRTG
jgi:hypothetical protein